MKQRLSNKHKWLKSVNLTADDDLYIGIDTHKKPFHVALWLNDAPAIDFVTTAHIAKLIEILDKLRPAIKRIVYEAGPTGYALARALQKAHLPVNVVAPSKTPRKPAGDSKTDSLGAGKTFNRLVHNTGHPNKAITAVARKLAIHLWKMACLNEPYDPVIDKSA